MTRRLHIKTVDQSEKTDEDLLDAIQELIETVDHYIPQIKELVRQAQEGEINIIVISQDSFAGLYHVDEYTLFGMVMTYIAYHGVDAMVVPDGDDVDVDVED